jgi:hypothetical protein
MLSVSLSKTHGLAVKAAKAAGTALGPTTMVEARYSHRQAPLPVPVSVKTFFLSSNISAVLTMLRIRIRRNHMFLGLPNPNQLVKDTDPAPDPSIIKQN